MRVQVRFFAGLRERVGSDGMELDVAEGSSVADVWAAAVAGQAMPENILAARNMEYADFSASVSEGDEVAFFPPVTGGCR